MKKILIASSICLLAATSAMAADTYTGTLLESFQKKVDSKAAPIVNKEKELQAKQKAVLELKQKQEAERQQQLAARQALLEEQKKQQEELINKKKQQIQAQKDALKQQKEDWKSIFSWK